MTPLDNKKRVDQVICCQPCFAHEATAKLVAAHAARPAGGESTVGFDDRHGWLSRFNGLSFDLGPAPSADNRQVFCKKAS
jgi:hypothetical protein